MKNKIADTKPLFFFARIIFRARTFGIQIFGTNFHAISRKFRLCAKMLENLSARKLVRIRYVKPDRSGYRDRVLGISRPQLANINHFSRITFDLLSDDIQV